MFVFEGVFCCSSAEDVFFCKLKDDEKHMTPMLRSSFQKDCHMAFSFSSGQDICIYIYICWLDDMSRLSVDKNGHAMDWQLFRSCPTVWRESLDPHGHGQVRVLWTNLKTSMDNWHANFAKPPYCWWFRNPKQPPGMYPKDPVNHGISTTNLNWLAEFLNHQQYH